MTRRIGPGLLLLLAATGDARPDEPPPAKFPWAADADAAIKRAIKDGLPVVLVFADKPVAAAEPDSSSVLLAGFETPVVRRLAPRAVFALVLYDRAAKVVVGESGVRYAKLLKITAIPTTVILAPGPKGVVQTGSFVGISGNSGDGSLPLNLAGYITEAAHPQNRELGTDPETPEQLVAFLAAAHRWGRVGHWAQLHGSPYLTLNDDLVRRASEVADAKTLLRAALKRKFGVSEFVETVPGLDVDECKARLARVDSITLKGKEQGDHFLFLKVAIGLSDGTVQERTIWAKEAGGIWRCVTDLKFGPEPDLPVKELEAWRKAHDGLAAAHDEVAANVLAGKYLTRAAALAEVNRVYEAKFKP